MKFFQDATDVFFKAFGDHAFSVSSVFCEFTIGGHEISIKWYGVIIAFGFLLAVLFGGRMAYKWKMSLDKMIDVLIYGTILGIIGARLYYVAFEWDTYKDDLLSIFATWKGGLAIYGGIIGGIIGAFIVCKVRKLNFFNLLDIAAMSLLIGQGIGRWGNFANQEAFGTNTDLPWGMWSQKISDNITYHAATLTDKGIAMDPNGYVHPTFLYESIWCIVGFVLLYIICRKFRRFSGQIFLCYGMWYGTGRMIIEGLRTDSLYIGDSTLRVSQLLSAALVLACLAVFFVLMVKYTKHPKPIEGVDFFPDDPEIKAREEKAALKKQKKAEKKAKKEAANPPRQATASAPDESEAEAPSPTPDESAAEAPLPAPEAKEDSDEGKVN